MHAGVLSAQASASTTGRADQVPGDALGAVSFMLFVGRSNPPAWLKSQRAKKAFNTKERPALHRSSLRLAPQRQHLLTLPHCLKVLLMI